MLKVHEFISKLILDLIDGVYPLFRRFMPLKTFRYAACGGGNTVLDILLFFISYNYILETLPVHIGWLTISPHIASFMISFTVTFPIGFYLSRYVVFQETSVRKSKQLFRYFMVVFGMHLPKLHFSKIICGRARLECYFFQDCDHLFCGYFQLYEPKELHI